MPPPSSLALRLLAPLVIASLGLALAACDSGSAPTSASTARPTIPRGPRQPNTNKERRGAGKPESGGGGGPSPAGQSGEGTSRAHPRTPLAPLRVSGGGSAQFLVKGGDNSVQQYGSEASRSELREVAERVHSFYATRFAGQSAKACSYLSRSTIEGFQRLAEQSPQLKGGGCAATLAAVSIPPSPSLRRRLTSVDAAALRIEGEKAFLIYTGPPGRTAYAMPLRREAGEWKLGALSAEPLPAAE